MGDSRPTMAEALDAFAVAVTVQRPDDASPIPTRGIWMSPAELLGTYGVDLGRIDPRRILVLPRAEIETAPTGTVIAAPEMEGEAVKTWTVEGYADNAKPDEVRVFLKVKD